MSKNPVTLDPVVQMDPRDTERKIDQVLQYGSLADLKKLFDEGMDVNQTDVCGRTALQLLSAKGNEAGVEMMLARGADVNKVFMYQDRLPMTALDAAEQKRQANIAKMLKEHGAKTGQEIAPLLE